MRVSMEARRVERKCLYKSVILFSQAISVALPPFVMLRARPSLVRPRIKPPRVQEESHSGGRQSSAKGVAMAMAIELVLQAFAGEVLGLYNLIMMLI